MGFANYSTRERCHRASVVERLVEVHDADDVANARVVALGNRLFIERNGRKHALDVFRDFDGIHVGCTVVSKDAWELLKKRVDEKKKISKG